MFVEQSPCIVYQHIDGLSFRQEAVDQRIGIFQKTEICEFKANICSAGGLFDCLGGMSRLSFISDD